MAIYTAPGLYDTVFHNTEVIFFFNLMVSEVSAENSGLHGKNRESDLGDCLVSQKQVMKMHIIIKFAYNVK